LKPEMKEQTEWGGGKKNVRCKKAKNGDVLIKKTGTNGGFCSQINRGKGGLARGDVNRGG